MYIDDNALNDHKGNFSKTAKKYLHKLPAIIAAAFWDFMFISKVNFVTLAQIISKTHHSKKTFPWQVIPDKSDPRAILRLSKQCKTNSWGLS